MSHHPFHLRSYEQRVYEVPCKRRANQVFPSQHPPPPAPLVWVVHVIPCITAVVHAWSSPTSTVVLAFARRHGHHVLVCMLPSFNLLCECFAFDLGQQPTLKSMPPSASSHNRPSEMSSSSSAKGPPSSLCSKRRRRKDCIPTYAHMSNANPIHQPKKARESEERRCDHPIYAKYPPTSLYPPLSPPPIICAMYTPLQTYLPRQFFLCPNDKGWHQKSAYKHPEGIYLEDGGTWICKGGSRVGLRDGSGNSPFPPPLPPSYIQQAARLGNKGRQTRLHPPVGNQSLR
jgi:hypothetical protein